MSVLAALLLGLALSAPPALRPQGIEPARAGWEALAAGRTHQAADAFAEALRARPTDPHVLLGAGVAAHQLGAADAARRFLLDALRYNAKLTPASLLLGELLYGAGDVAAAISTYERALVHAPDDGQLRLRLERWRGELALHDRFTHTLGDHFTVLFEGPAEADLARRAVDILEAAYWRIGSILYTYPIEPVTVVLYTREQFRDITQSPDWAGGLYDGRIRLPVKGALENAREFERVLTHEFVHALVRSLAPRGVPQWLNEGLATNFDGTAVERLDERLQHVAVVPSLTELERSFSGLDARMAGFAYAQSAVAVRRLLAEAGAPAIVAILGELGRGAPFPEAFARHAHMSYQEFQEKLAAR